MWRLCVVVMVLGVVMWSPGRAEAFMSDDMELTMISGNLTVAGSMDATDVMLGAGFRTGSVSLISRYFHLDVDYGFLEERAQIKAGGDLHFLFVGLQGGFLLDIPTQEADVVPGAYAGLSINLPLGFDSDLTWGLFGSLGGNFRFREENIAEAYLRVGVYYAL